MHLERQSLKSIILFRHWAPFWGFVIIIIIIIIIILFIIIIIFIIYVFLFIFFLWSLKSHQLK